MRALLAGALAALVLAAPVASATRPAAPRAIPSWAWSLASWHLAKKAGPRPAAPVRVPRWYWSWLAWRYPKPRPAVPPTPAPSVPPEAAWPNTAILVNAGAAVPEWMARVGIRMVAAQPEDVDLDTGRWNGFTRCAFVISRAPFVEAEAEGFARQGRTRGCLIVDTESHKADMAGQMAWTETLYAVLRRELGPSFPLANVTFGRDGSPAVINHETLRRHHVAAMWEAYDGYGRTTGPRATIAKARAEGWARPFVVLGDKNLGADAAELRLEHTTYGWGLWAPEQAGSTVLALER